MSPPVGLVPVDIGGVDDDDAAAAAAATAASPPTEAAAVATVAAAGVATVGRRCRRLDDRIPPLSWMTSPPPVSTLTRCPRRRSFSSPMTTGEWLPASMSPVLTFVVVADQLPSPSTFVASMSPALPVLMTPPSVAVFVVLSPKVMSPKSRLTPPCWTSWPASGLRMGSLLLSDVVVAQRVVVAERWVCGAKSLRGRRRCRGSGDRLLQAVDRVAAALDDRGGRHSGGHGVHLGGRDVLHAGVLHGACRGR